MKIHIVKKGDTLYDLAGKYKVELKTLIDLNQHIQDPNQIDVGMKVKIPTGPQPVAAPLSDYAHKHIVKQGDSLWKLGKAWEVPLQAMIKANPQLKNPNVLMTGEVVYIPKLESGHVYTTQDYTPSTMPYPPSMPILPAADYPGMTHQETALGDISTPAGPGSAFNPALVSNQTSTSTADLSGELNPGFSDWINQAQLQHTMEPQTAAEEPSGSGNLPTAAPQEELATQPTSPDLNLPYHQAHNPFEQFHIESTEVSVYSLPMEHSGETVSPQLPQMPPAYEGQQPMPAYPAYQGQFGYSDGGCGCGGTHFAPPGIQPWHTYPTHPPMAPAYSPYLMQLAQPMYPYPMMSAPCYPLTGEFSAGPAFGTEHPRTGMSFPTSNQTFQTPPEAYIHRWTGDEGVSNEPKPEAAEEKSTKTAGKTSGTVKKARSSAGNDAATSQLRRQQNREPRAEPRPNLPWINV